VAQIKDGLSNTLLLIEMAGRPQRYANDQDLGQQEYYAGTWAGVNGEMLYSIKHDATTSPVHGDCFINCNSFYNPFSFHHGGVNVLHCDGSAHLLSDNVAFETWWRLVQPNDGGVTTGYP
jgi:hypothetical protein